MSVDDIGYVYVCEGYVVHLVSSSVRLLCFVQAKTLYWYGCIYFLASLVLMCVDVMVMSSA